MKRILVPTDFSPCANAAAEVAMQLAKRSGADIYFLHLAIDNAGPASVPGKSVITNDPEIGQIRQNLDQLVKAAEADGINAKQELYLGTGQEKIEDFIKPYQIDWLVMGSHGATGIREMIIGSKTQRVIRNIKVPSIVVKHMPEKAEIEHIVFASNFKKDTSHSLNIVVDFSRLWDARLHLLFVNLFSHLIEENVARLMMAKQMEKYSKIDYTLNITETNDKEFGISKFASEVGADMIAVSIESKSLLGRLLNPNVAEQLINHSSLPLLIVNQK